MCESLHSGKYVYYVDGIGNTKAVCSKVSEIKIKPQRIELCIFKQT